MDWFSVKPQGNATKPSGLRALGGAAGRLLVGAGALVAAWAACGCGQTMSPAAPATARGERPNWLAPYTAEQRLLLRLENVPEVSTEAYAVYPDLTRFGYAQVAAAEVPEDLLLAARQVSAAVRESPRLYVFRTAPVSTVLPLANTEALFGPKPTPEPDPWQRTVLSSRGIAHIAVAAPPDAVLPRVSQAKADMEQDQEAAAMTQLAKVATEVGKVPGFFALLADAALAAEDLTQAEKACEKALRIDERHPQGLRAMAELQAAKGNMTAALDYIARALAVYPLSAKARDVAATITGLRLESPTLIEPPFIEVTPEGAIVVVSCDTPFCQGYAMCKAAARFEPSFRTKVLQTSTEPYHLSTTEEVLCLNAGLGMHANGQRENPSSAVADPLAERLIRLAEEQGLAAFAMLHIFGSYNPQWLRLAPEPLFKASVDYVKTYWLAQSPTVPDQGETFGQPGFAWLPRGHRGYSGHGGHWEHRGHGSHWQHGGHWEHGGHGGLEAVARQRFAGAASVAGDARAPSQRQ